MIALTAILKHRATWGVGIAVGVLIACGWHGHNKYGEGKRDGIASERAAWSSEVALARASATASQVAADAATSALRDSIRVRDARIASLQEAAALARGNYRAALVAYEAAKVARDTTVPVSDAERACDAVATSCANAIAAEATVRESLTVQLRAAIRLTSTQDSVIRMEPARTTLTVREALAVQRSSFRAPSRVTWGTLGAVVGAVAALVVAR